MRHQSQNDSRDCNGDDMKNVIDRATKEAKQYLHRTQDPANPHKLRATVCIMSQTVLLCTISNDCMAQYWGPRGAYVMSYQANAILKT